MFAQPSPKKFRLGFSRLELCLVMGALAILILFAWVGVSVFGKLRTNSRFSTCVSNLKELGAAVSLYTADNTKKLPYAGLRDEKARQISWDDLLNSKFEGGANAGQIEAPLMQDRIKVLQCPSDKLDEISPIFAKQDGHRRSYAMPGHNMSKANWPPNSQNQTGVGLAWDVSRSSVYPDSIKRWIATDPQNHLSTVPVQAAINLAMILEPAATIAITERVHTNNVIGNIIACTIENATEHIHHRSSLDAKTYHSSKITYLFVDGHVETLNPLETLGSQNQSPAIQSGMWTIKPSD